MNRKIVFFSNILLQDAGSSTNPFLASILIGAVRLVMSVISIYILKTFARRTLMFISTFSMAVCMFLAGLFTKWIQEGTYYEHHFRSFIFKIVSCPTETTTMKWVPVAALLVYVIASTLGLLPIPTMIIAELFPLEIRGIGYSVSYSMFCVFMFAALQNYYNLSAFFHGSTNLQWFFACICLGGMVYSYIFVPETFRVPLQDITEYFKTNWMYLGYKRPVKRKGGQIRAKLTETGMA